MDRREALKTAIGVALAGTGIVAESCNDTPKFIVLKYEPGHMPDNYTAELCAGQIWDFLKIPTLICPKTIDIQYATEDEIEKLTPISRADGYRRAVTPDSDQQAYFHKDISRLPDGWRWF